MTDYLNGKVALVTGGAMGLGKAITDRLLHQGCRVAFIDLNESAGMATERAFRATFGEDHVIFMKCDITKDEAFEDCFVRVKKKFGRLDIVVNNAGFAGEESWRRIFEINTTDLYYSRTGVKVSCLCPEPIETDLWRGITTFCQEIALNTPYITENYSSGVQRPENVAKGVIKLIQDGINGAALLSLYDEGLVYHEFSSVR
ncbi:hypothetical protein HPB49_007581 [Dermacentor silvarum]|uniref:Uncharacterized protein n=1 Tax=Dermacentor silvarum TaxID=543639 RepID=A0ACB8C2K2_DERSI|nr:hypothetical protein HPB49_007581 [Dermacentor silvarum]